MESFKQLFGQRVKLIRKKKQLTQAQLAEKAATSTAYIGEVEGGKRNITIAVIYKIAMALNIHPIEFFRFEINNLPELNESELNNEDTEREIIEKMILDLDKEQNEFAQSLKQVLKFLEKNR